jgi:large subunit ribosomal protein L3
MLELACKSGFFIICILYLIALGKALVRNQDRDGYEAVQLEAQVTSKRSVLKEFRVEGIDSEVKEGGEIKVDIFEVGDKVKISGKTKAKGFQGVMKRHGFHGSPATHGHRHDHRAPGSIGSAFPQHVIKGKKMAGRMGGERASVKGVSVSFIDAEKNLLGVQGAVPGVPGGVVEIRTV